MAYHLCDLYRFEEMLLLDRNVYENFFSTLEDSYLENPYHNSRHAADVCNSLLYFIYNTDFKKHLTMLEMLCAIIAACAHDVGHGGLTNRYLTINRDKLAIRYND